MKVSCIVFSIMHVNEKICSLTLKPKIEKSLMFNILFISWFSLLETIAEIII